MRREFILSAISTWACLAASAALAAPTPPLEPVVIEPKETLRRTTGPGTSEGSLSARFPEIEVSVSSSFAHDAGMMSTVKSLQVGGKPCATGDVVQALVTLRKGWTQSGGRTDADIIRVFSAFADDWTALFENAGRLTAPTPPRGLGSLPMPAPLSYHPPRFAIYALDDGDRIVTHAFFRTWDGGNHGQQFEYVVEAYRVSTGARYVIAPRADAGRLTVAKPSSPVGAQPVDPSVPRPFQLSR